MKALGIAAVVMMASVGAWAQDEETTEIVSASSCSLFVKTTVRPVPMTEPYGQVRVDATLCDKDGVPIADQEILLSATSGSLSCLPVDSVTPPGDSLNGPCFVTRGNGTITMFLTHVPFNKPGKVFATCSYKNFKLKSIGTYIIIRKTVSPAKPAKKYKGGIIPGSIPSD